MSDAKAQINKKLHQAVSKTKRRDVKRARNVKKQHAAKIYQNFDNDEIDSDDIQSQEDHKDQQQNDDFFIQEQGIFSIN